MAEASNSNPPTIFRFELPCDLAQVRSAALAVHRFLARQGCGEMEVTDCELSLVEACNNAIQYVGPAARALPVGIEVRCDAEQIELRVTDHTPGFPWPERASLPPPEQERGRGIYLIQSVMNYTQYTSEGTQNVLVLRKQRT
jgi:anti-sigma regulatory factor (Ser/Thr protein kinase)